jgi:spore maturation protein CgeB
MRLAGPFLGSEFEDAVIERVRTFRPSVVMTYKGAHISASLVRAIRGLGFKTVNVYPDCSPHAHGIRHREAVGEYDLVISTKPYQPSRWEEVYGYRNECVFVPQGYDPLLHLAESPCAGSEFDVVLVATFRSEYLQLLRDFAQAVSGMQMSVAIGGSGWSAARHLLPPNWVFPGELHGRSYVEWLRRGRICIAPVTRRIVVDGRSQPGDEDSTRSYELAAAYCFFLHRRTEFIRRVYDEQTEVPLFDDGAEHARKVLSYLADDERRMSMAAAAHRRAVPTYSLDSRVVGIVEILGSRSML